MLPLKQHLVIGPKPAVGPTTQFLLRVKIFISSQDGT
jgi:hypothetical protein